MDQFWALIRNRLILRYECDGKWLDYRLCLGCHPTCSHVICTLSNSKWVQLDMMTTLGIKDLTQLFPNEWPASTQTTLLRMLFQDIVLTNPVEYRFQGQRPHYPYCQVLTCCEFVQEYAPRCAKHLFH